jgi:hypothetical protein
VCLLAQQRYEQSKCQNAHEQYTGCIVKYHDWVLVLAGSTLSLRAFVTGRWLCKLFGHRIVPRLKNNSNVPYQAPDRGWARNASLVK